jgi:alginate O-acetyltransferase complex protein AlgI
MRSRTHTYDKFARGIAFFAIGMAKKILLANPLGLVADRAFAAANLHWYDAWYGLTSYAFQIYFDFSGYSDMALGLALMMGFVLIKNFDAPYQADSITDFWRRWHISLSTWLRDYIYIPLGGNRIGPKRTYFNLMVVMLIGGLWHGANWTFVIWGAIHGFMLAFERWQGKNSPYRQLPRPMRVGITFVIVCLAWVFFRAPTLHQATHYLANLFALTPTTFAADIARVPMYDLYHVLVYLAAVLVVWKMPQTWTFTSLLTLRRAAVCMALYALAVLFMWTQSENPFIYFQF